MHIGHFDLEQDILVVAEIGNNHEGDLSHATDMVVAAAEAGADAVKFQTIEPTLLVSRDQTARLEQLGRFRLSREDYETLADVAANAGVMFLSTPFYLDAVAWLDKRVPAFKIASGDCTYTRLLETVAQTGKPILLSTGATTLEEVRTAQSTIEDIWTQAGVQPGLVLLHCTVSYPTAPEDANLSALSDLAQLGTTIGYSDHTIGVEAAVLAVAMGARVIEKHFTLDKNFSNFRDHTLSADPDDLAELVRRLRAAKALIGSGGKRVLPCEAEARTAVRRSVHAARDIDTGTTLTLDDTVCLRPGSGIVPAQEASLVGRTVKSALVAGTIIDDGTIA